MRVSSIESVLKCGGLRGQVRFAGEGCVEWRGTWPCGVLLADGCCVCRGRGTKCVGSGLSDCGGYVEGEVRLLFCEMRTLCEKPSVGVYLECLFVCVCMKVGDTVCRSLWGWPGR